MTRDLGWQPEVVETHISTVFFAGDRAYKVLKPVRTSFLDHRTPAQRQSAIDQELALNRRLAPDVYLGVAPVLEDGEETDRMLVMRRLPADRRLSTLLVDGPDPAGQDCLRGVARRIAAFHAGEAPHPDGERFASRDAVRQNWSDNLRDIRAAGADDLLPLVDEVERLALRYLDHSEELFAHRLQAGWVRDGHGDLTAEDIFCCADGPRIIDCLAFDARYRINDVLNDIGFLAMDADRLAGRATAKLLLDHYTEFSGEHHPESLAWHYVAYRASVRAKVSALRLSQGHLEARADLVAYLDQCRRHLSRSARRVIMVGGAPGTGKSTLAAGLGDELALPVLRSDAIRRELTTGGWREQGEDGIDEGVYDPAITDAVYDHLLRRARTLLREGCSVVLDASFASGADRARVMALAAEWGAELHQVRCVVDLATATERVAGRRRNLLDASDAHPVNVPALAARFEAWPDATEITTDGDIGTSRDQAMDQLGLLTDTT